MCKNSNMGRNYIFKELREKAVRLSCKEGERDWHKTRLAGGDHPAFCGLSLKIIQYIKNGMLSTNIKQQQIMTSLSLKNLTLASV